MKVEVKQGDGLFREVSVEVPAERVKAEMDKKFVEVSRSVTIKGFRKGKAPMERIKSMYAGEVRADVVDELIKATLPEAVRENALRVATRPTLTDFNFTDDGGFAYTAQVEVFPEVGTIQYDGLTVTGAQGEVQDKDVDEFIEYLRKRTATMRPVERLASATDWVTADLHKIADPKLALQTDTFPNTELDLSNPITIREFREHIPGMAIGDEKQIEITYPDDYSERALAGASITYMVKLKGVKEVILPEVDDAFAAQTGIGQTVLELRLKLRENLQRQREDNLVRSQKREIVRQMVEKNPILVPEGMVTEYLDSVAEDFKKQYGKSTEADIAELRQNYRQVGIDAMRWDLIWRQLAQQEKLEVMASDTENWIKEFALRNQITPEQATDALNSSGKVAGLRDSLLEEKVLDFLLGRAKVTAAANKD